jgi:DNA processing protein
VLAVPGHPLDPRAAGCNLLLRDGATLVRDAADVEEALATALARWREEAAQGAPATQRPVAQEPGAAHHPPGPHAPLAAPSVAPRDLRARILGRLGPSPLAEDQLIRDLGEGAAVVVPALTDLELEGRILRQPGGLLSLGRLRAAARASD